MRFSVRKRLVLHHTNIKENIDFSARIDDLNFASFVAENKSELIKK